MMASATSLATVATTLRPNAQIIMISQIVTAWRLALGSDQYWRFVLDPTSSEMIMATAANGVGLTPVLHRTAAKS
jgi:hypothetical protein